MSEILKEYGDIANVMEIFGVKRVGGFGLRKFITDKTAAFVHRVRQSGSGCRQAGGVEA